MRVLHIHIDREIDEEMHVHVHLSGHDGLDVGSDIAPDASDERYLEDVSVIPDELESIYSRFAAYDPTTPVRQVVESLRSAGWVAHTPRHRPETVNRTAYIRLTYDGNERSVTAYVQTNALAVDRVADFELMKEQPGAVVAGQKVSFHFYDRNKHIVLGDALAAVDVLRRAADGEP